MARQGFCASGTVTVLAFTASSCWSVMSTAVPVPRSLGDIDAEWLAVALGTPAVPQVAFDDAPILVPRLPT